MVAGLVRRALGAAGLAALVGLTSCTPIVYARVFNETGEPVVVDSAWFAHIAPHRAKRVAFGLERDRTIRVGDCEVRYSIDRPRYPDGTRNHTLAFQIEPDLTVYVLDWDARDPLRGDALAAVPERMRIRPTETVCEDPARGNEA